MDDITQKYEFQQILRDAAEYRVLRRIMDAGRGIEVAEMEKKLAAPNPRRLDLNK
jgi:hypothetical protein